MRPEFNRSLFARDVRAWLDRRGQSYREAVTAYPCANVAMFSRACTEQKMSVESVLVLCRIVGLDPMNYLRLDGQENQAVTALGKRETSES